MEIESHAHLVSSDNNDFSWIPLRSKAIWQFTRPKGQLLGQPLAGATAGATAGTIAGTTAGTTAGITARRPAKADSDMATARTKAKLVIYLFIISMSIS